MLSDLIRKPGFRTWSIALALLLLCLISYGPLITMLGFYWDDWPAVWYLHMLGPGGFRQAFAVDRPPLGFLFMLTTPIMGESALAWQLFGILTRWLSAFTLWWVLCGVWPSRYQQLSWVALLYAIYPGFQQQYISLTYSHGWIILSAFLLSMGLMIWAVRRPRWFWLMMVASWLLSAAVLFTDEYYFGLELLRPVFLWIALEEGTPDWRGRLRRVTARWAPFLVTLLAFLVWRVVLQKTPRGQVQIFDRLSQNPMRTIFDLGRTIIQDIFNTSVMAWIQTLKYLRVYHIDLRLLLAYGLIVLATAALTIWFLRSLGEEKASVRFWVQLTTIGLLGLLVAGWPFWATYLPIKLKFPWDRFTLPMMLGACMLFVGLLGLIVRASFPKMIILGVWIGLAVGLQFQVANTYRQDWNIQKEFFWQLTWRAPAITPGTALLTAALPFKYYTDNSLTAPLNYIYAPDLGTAQMPYLLYDIKVRQDAGVLQLKPGYPILQPYRAVDFRGSTSQAIVFIYSPPGCVKVLDSTMDVSWPQLPNLVSKALPLSNPNLIQKKSSTFPELPVGIFGPEPDHGWCYYFEKADLARQVGNWKEIVNLGEPAFRITEKPANPAELIPFIEGYAHTGHWDRAGELTARAVRSPSHSRAALCNAWLRIRQTTPMSEGQRSAISVVDKLLVCGLQ